MCNQNIFIFCFLIENCARSTIWIVQQLGQFTGVTLDYQNKQFSRENILMAKLLYIVVVMMVVVVVVEHTVTVCWLC